MNTLGNQAEKVALSYLEQQGLTLIKKNYQTRLGEIDLNYARWQKYCVCRSQIKKK